MWMVGYNEGGEFNMADYAFNGRKLRPLMPRPLLTSPNTTATATSSARIHHHGHGFLSQYHNLAAAAAAAASVGEQSKRELGAPAAVVVSSSRWNPTPEQLRALEELYRRGTRTPSAEQIQQITAQLRRYGKIEGKNVFYWFQNHKARERQKRRRQMESASASAEPRDFEDAAATSLEKKDYYGAASRTTVFEVEHNNNNWAPSSSTTNCTTTLAEESVSIQRAAKAADCRTTDGWLQFEDGELQQRRNFMERNATWQMMQLSCPLPPNNNNSSTSTTSMTTATASASASLTTTRLMDPKLVKPHDLSFFISPHTQNRVIHFSTIRSEVDDSSVESQQTLQLFPTRRDESSDHNNTSHHHKETEMSAQEAMNAPSQFFEFLPLKN